MPDYEHTSLRPYVEMFEKHVAAVLRDARLVKKGESEWFPERCNTEH
jgi:DNA primase small subunit